MCGDIVNQTDAEIQEIKQYCLEDLGYHRISSKTIVLHSAKIIQKNMDMYELLKVSENGELFTIRDGNKKIFQFREPQTFFGENNLILEFQRLARIQERSKMTDDALRKLSRGN